MDAALAALLAAFPHQRGLGPTGDEAADALLGSRWAVLRQEGRALTSQAELLRGVLPDSQEVQWICSALQWALRDGVIPAPLPAPVALPARSTPGVFQVSLGVGSPSTLGCTSVDGRTIRWHLFTDRAVGLVAAFEQLQLALVGLPRRDWPEE